MNLADIVALAKEGYKPSDIKELIALASSQEGEPKKEEERQVQDEKTEQHEDGKERPDEAPKKSTEASSTDSAIDEYKRKIEDLENQVKKLQSENVHKDYNKERPSDEETLNDITRSFM